MSVAFRRTKLKAEVMSYQPQHTDPVVCHCLGITHSEIIAAGEFGDCETVSDVKDLTKAGSGCTSCHSRIIAMLQASRQAKVAAAQT
jgi:NAD(P)H-nitrite reductase large subunit